MINLELTPEEAGVMTHILGEVGGQPHGYRGEADKVLQKLYTMIGLDDITTLTYPSLSTGSIMYKNEVDTDLSEIAIMDNIIQMFSAIDSEPTQPSLTPYQLGRFAYQNDEPLRAGNPFSRDEAAYHGWRKGWSDESWSDEKWSDEKWYTNKRERVA